MQISRYSLSNMQIFKNSVFDKYLSKSSERHTAQRNYARVLQTELHRMEDDDDITKFQVFSEMLDTYESAVKEAGNTFLEPQRELLESLGSSQLSHMLSYSKDMVHMLHRDCLRFKFDSKLEFWKAMLKVSKYVPARLYILLEEEKELHETLYEALQYWMQEIENSTDFEILEQIFAGLESITIKLGKNPKETKRYSEKRQFCRIKSLGLDMTQSI
eukprot:TRINITY_DN8829_c1_g2_i2.p1 TRINITY_DN8829_c1_g2~~TRINITY_DN8829_c1_g2_i2.p1  ORF type:complete len:216 (+),score=33.83 TRINITY_DN8829_c1_g2_i2:95-742(+)